MTGFWPAAACAAEMTALIQPQPEIAIERPSRRAPVEPQAAVVEPQASVVRPERGLFGLKRGRFSLSRLEPSPETYFTNRLS